MPSVSGNSDVDLPGDTHGGNRQEICDYKQTAYSSRRVIYISHDMTRVCLEENGLYYVCGYLLRKLLKLEIRSMERGICPIAVFYFALKRSFFNIYKRFWST